MKRPCWENEEEEEKCFELLWWSSEDRFVVGLPNDFDPNIWLIHHRQFSVRHRPVREREKQKVSTKS